MPYARRTSFLDDIKESWQAVQAETVAKGKKPLDTAVLLRAAEDLSIVAAGLWIRHKLRKKGAPEWVAYAVSTVDLTLTQIAVALRRHEQAVKKGLEAGEPDLKGFQPDAVLADLLRTMDLFGNKKGADDGEQNPEHS